MSRKTWTAPSLSIHGSVEQITAQVVKPKTLGLKDDFGVTGISDP